MNECCEQTLIDNDYPLKPNPNNMLDCLYDMLKEANEAAAYFRLHSDRPKRRKWENVAQKLFDAGNLITDSAHWKYIVEDLYWKHIVEDRRATAAKQAENE